MKNIIKKITQKGFLIVIITFALSMIAITKIQAEEILNTARAERFIEGSSTLVNRIGSLSVGPSLYIPNFFTEGSIGTNNASRCTNKDNLRNSNDTFSGAGEETCLNVEGGSLFSNIRVNSSAYFLADLATRVVVGSSFLKGNENTLESDVFVVADDSGQVNESILVDGLKRSETDLFGMLTFSPRDKTTKNQVCADATGKLYICGDGVAETYTWCSGDQSLCDGVWDVCSTGSQSRAVSCQDSTGLVVNDSLCTSAKPDETQSCIADVNGVCDNSIENECTAGSLNDIGDSSSEYLWQCVGTGTGSTDSCSLAIPATNGSCSPTLNSCYAGTFNDVADTTTNYQWQCEGINGGTTANCAKTIIPTNGSCGTARNTCTDGTVNDAAIADTATEYLWRCDGVNGGTNSDTCSKLKSVEYCKWYVATSEYQTQPANSDSTGCINGATYSDYTDSYGEFTWKCAGATGTDTCSVDRQSMCVSYGTSTKYESQPATNDATGCHYGTYSDDTDYLPYQEYLARWKWRCSDGQVEHQCNITRVDYIDGTCKDYTGDQTSQPATNTETGCLTGTFAELADNDYYFKWTCNAINGGFDRTCSEPKLGASCKSYGTTYYTSQPATNTATGCDVGTYADATDEYSNFNWTCTEGTSTVDCSANVDYRFECQDYPGTYASSPATDAATGCVYGIYLDKDDSGTEFKWQCESQVSGSITSCSADREVGVCQDYSGAHMTQPATNTSTGCTSGTYYDRTDSDTVFRWGCTGVNGADDDLCAATVVQGECNSDLFLNRPTSQPTGTAACSKGTFVDTPDTKTWGYDYECHGGGGQVTSCTAIAETGDCSDLSDLSYIYQSQQGTNTANACDVGTYVDLPDNDYWFEWKCQGSTLTNNVFDGKCYSGKERGSCVYFPGTGYTSQPANSTATGCEYGTYNDTADSSATFNWECIGAYGTPRPCQAIK